MTIWTDFVKQYAAKNNMSYACALSDKKMKEEYYKKNPKKTKEQKKGEDEEKMKKTFKSSTLRFKKNFVKPYLKDKDGTLRNDMINKYKKFSKGLKQYIEENASKIHEIVKDPAPKKEKQEE